MLEPTAIHSYEPPAYSIRPPSPKEPPPPSLPFACIVLECPDAPGGPTPALLHTLRGEGCKIVLARIAPDKSRGGGSTPSRGGNTPVAGSQPALHVDWYAAVFDHVIDVPAGGRANRTNPLERYLKEQAIDRSKAICFASTDAGARAFTLADAGLIVAPTHDMVWEVLDQPDDEPKRATIVGADLAAAESPTARQLSWLYRVCSEHLWCTFIWLTPPVGEFKALECVTDTPVAEDRADLTTVASPSMQARGHPPWVSSKNRDSSKDIPSQYRDMVWHSGNRPAIPACEARLGDEMVVCPDWTPLTPLLHCEKPAPVVRGTRFPQQKKKELCTVNIAQEAQKVNLYCHSLDVGVAQVNHMFEAIDPHSEQHVRVSSRRLVNLARPGQAATEMSVTLRGELKQNRTVKDITIRSTLRLDCPPGYRIEDEVTSEVSKSRAVITATMTSEDKKKSLTVRASHRLLRDDGRGEVQLVPGTHAADGTKIVDIKNVDSTPTERSVELVFLNPRRGTRYTVEKVVSVYSDVKKDPPIGAKKKLSQPLSTSHLRPPPCPASQESEKETTLPEIEEEHRSAWRTEWDKADIEVEGSRLARTVQKFVRVFRYHQVSRGDPVGSGKADVPLLARQLFRSAVTSLSGLIPGFNPDEKISEEYVRPSQLILSRFYVADPRGPLVRINPKVPPSCQRLTFNAALGGRWHRFTLTSGKVRILVQGPILEKTVQQLMGIESAPSFVIPEDSGVGNSVEVRASPWHEVQVQHALTDLGRPDGSIGGFYSVMRRTRFMRSEVVKRLLTDVDGDYKDITLIHPLKNAYASLQSVPRPIGWQEGDDADLHTLKADESTQMNTTLSYEKNELLRDTVWLEGKWTKVEGSVLAGDDIETQELTVEAAKLQAASIVGCKGFTFQGVDKIGTDTFKILFKSAHHIDEEESKERQSMTQSWTSYIYEDGETALWNMLREQHEDKFKHVPTYAEEKPVLTWFDEPVPSWDELIQRGMKVLNDASSRWCDEERQLSDVDVEPTLDRGISGRLGQRRSGEALDRSSTADHMCSFTSYCEKAETQKVRIFRNFITDRDGTTNNYCDRYASSVQSAYNAAWLCHFARTCTDNAMFITAAPLGGRPSAEGLMELSVAPRGVFTYTGSKGREYFDTNAQRVMETEELPVQQRETMEELHRRILALCSKPGNTKFLGIGSGLQRKFGEVTMARNDPAGTVPEPESKRFMAAVRRVKEELDPDGLELDLQDTGTDMELFPRAGGGRPAFDKGAGIRCLDEKLGLRVGKGPNVVCGDTKSDFSMIETALRLMCGDKMVDIWLERATATEADEAEELDPEPAPPPDAIDSESDEQEEELTEEDKERIKREEEEALREEEEKAKDQAASLAVLFVISPESHAKDQNKPKLADKVIRLCQESGAHCAILPSPDVLVGCLREFANKVARRSVTDPNTDEQDEAPDEEKDGQTVGTSPEEVVIEGV